MNITMSAIEGTMLVAAGIIPMILLLGSIEKLLTVIDEIRYRKRIRRQVKMIRQNFDINLNNAA